MGAELIMEYRKINEFCEINIGKTPSRNNSNYWGTGSSWLSIADINKKYIHDTKEEITNKAIQDCNMKKVLKNTVVMSFKLSIGKIAILKKDMYTNEAIANFPIKDERKITSEYLYYALRTINFTNTDRAVMGATLNKAKLNELEIPYCSIEIQNKIVKVLNKAQRLINERKEQIESLDNLVKSKFIEMFGDPLKNTKGWNKGKIEDIIVKAQYGTSNKANEKSGKYKIIRMCNITYNGQLDFSDMKYIDLPEKEKKKYLVYKGEVLFNRTNSKELVGKTAVFKENEPMSYAGYLIKIIPNEKANGEFISAYMNTKYIKEKLFNMAKNIVGMANINAEELKKIDIYIPPIELQNQFADFVKETDKLKFEMEKSLKELENNFNSLMQGAFNGKLFNEK